MTAYLDGEERRVAWYSETNYSPATRLQHAMHRDRVLGDDLISHGCTCLGSIRFGNLIDSKSCYPRMKQRFDPTTLEIYRALFTSVAEEMGIALRRTAFSPNIKERRDYSCAVFDAKGRVIAQGDHMPVHLGSMPMAVAAALEEIE